VPQARNFVSVDTGPFFDKALARQAGVGSYGKNTLIYVKGCGSWVVLGEMLTDVSLVPDVPENSDHCGDCEVCIKSCPTGAISAAYKIDVNRCISHLTQLKGYIPYDLRPLIGENVYGCDICQEVCPRNIDAAETDAFEFLRTYELQPLSELVNITVEEFRRSIKLTAAGWIKRTRLRRNAAIALGNARDPEAVPALIHALDDPESVIRAHAAWALGRIATPAAIDELRLSRTKEQNLRVQEEIDTALGGLQTD
jgi:epoxyqueuosine reductase